MDPDNNKRETELRPRCRGPVRWGQCWNPVGHAFNAGKPNKKRGAETHSSPDDPDYLIASSGGPQSERERIRSGP